MCYTPFLCCNSYSWITLTLCRFVACFETICTEWAWSRKRTIVTFLLRELFQKKTHKGSVFQSRRVEHRSLEAPWPQLRPAMNGSLFLTCLSACSIIWYDRFVWFSLILLLRYNSNRRLIWFSLSSSAAVKNRKYLSENYLESIEQLVFETSLIGHLSISNKMKKQSLLSKS